MNSWRFPRPRYPGRKDETPRQTMESWDVGRIYLPPCVNCFIPFSIKSSLTDTSEMPHILTCNHSVCENCLLKDLKRKNKILCNKCKQLSFCTPGLSDYEIKSLFPYNHFFIGLSVDKMCFIGENLEFKLQFEPAPKHSVPECNDCVKEATVRCVQCKVPYCDKCFSMVHNVRTLNDHKKVHVKYSLKTAMSLVNDESKGCQVHLQKFEFYCGQCEESACSRCLLARHHGHENVKELPEANAAKRDDLLDGFAKLTNVKTSLDNSAQKLAEYVANSHLSDRIKKAEIQIKHHFAEIHSRLGNLEFKLLKELKNDKNVKAARDLIEQINEKSEEIDELLFFASKLIKGNGADNFDFQKCITALNAKLNTPCHLYSNFEETENQSCFTYNIKIFSTLEEHCSVSLPKTRFSLLSDSEIPESFTKEDNLPKIVKEDVDKFLKNECPILELPKKIEVPVPTEPCSEGFVDFCPTDGLEPNMRISVIMSHIVSPQEFYVHRFGSEKKLQTMHQTISKFVKTESTLPMSRVIKGELYSVLYKNTTWYRARIVRFEDETLVKVQYIDYGPTENIPIRSLRQIPPRLNTKYMGHAIKCRLRNCFPISDQWDHTVIATMIKILNNQNSLMYIHKKENYELEVSLFCIAESGHYNNMSEALNFLGLAKAADDHEEFRPEFDCKQLLFKDHQIISPKTTFEATIVHVVNPSDFYIVDELPIEKRRYNAMEKQLQYCYNIPSPSSFNVYHPHFDMPVAAYVDDKWYRAAILSTSSDQKINVLLVDTGRKVDLSWKKVKILQKQFVELPKRAIRSCLDEIDPKESVWCAQSVEKLKSFMGKPLRVLVSFHDELLSVIMLYTLLSVEVCLNAEFVQDDLAVSTGPYSKTVEYQKFPIKAEETNASQKRETPSKITAPLVDNHNIYRFDDGTIKVRIIPQYINNPSEFYVSLAYIAHEMDRLEAEMDQEYSQNDHERLIDWNVGDKCALKLEHWMRGVIEKVNPDDTVEVTLCETGSTEVVDTAKIKRLLIKFHHQKEGAYRCHLGGLAPTNNVWSGIAITIFKEFIEENSMSLYIMQMDKDDNSCSTAVELFSKSTVDQGPLEPAKTCWKSYNHYLYMHGYAKPDGSCTWNSIGRVLSAPKNESNSDENSLISEPIQETDDLLFPQDGLIHGIQVDPEPGTSETDEPLNWKPAMKFENLELEGYATFVDQEGILIQSILENEPVIQKITQALDKRYQGTIQTPEDEITVIGAPCSAKFFSNKSYYRATIEKVSTLTYVKYVDFGTSLAVTSTEIRRPLFLDVPLQANHCKWHKIKPIGPMFSENALNEISALILEKNSKITLVELPDGTYGVDKFLLPNDVDLFELLVQRELAVFKHEFQPKESSENVEKEESGNLTQNNHYTSTFFWGSVAGSGKNFKTYSIPKLSTSLFVKYSAVLDETKVMLELCNGPREINRHNYHFSLFEQVMNDEASLLNFLSPPYLGKACCVFCNGQWHRALVYDEFENGLVSVILVDCGKLETVSGMTAREMKTEWFETSLKCVPVELFGLRVNKESEIGRRRLMELLSESLRPENDEALLCSIKDTSKECYVVEILYKGNRQRAYQNLIDLGYFYLDKNEI